MHSCQKTDTRLTRARRSNINILFVWITGAMISFIKVPQRQHTNSFQRMPETRKPHFELKRQKERRHREVSEQDNKAQQRSRRHLARCSSLQLLHTPPEHTLTCSISLSLSLQDANSILMWFCPEVSRKWNMSLWDLIELQMTVRGDRRKTRGHVVHDLISWVRRLWNWQAGLCYNMCGSRPLFSLDSSRLHAVVKYLTNTHLWYAILPKVFAHLPFLIHRV